MNFMKLKSFSKKNWNPIWILLLFLMIPIGICAQDVTVTGSVKDATGEAIIGANVRVVGNETIGTISNHPKLAY